MESHKNTNTISTKHFSSPTSDKCLRQITLKCRRFPKFTVTVTTQPMQPLKGQIVTLTMYSHGTSRLKSPPLLTGFPFMTNLVPGSLVDEAEGEIWQSKKICFSWLAAPFDSCPIPSLTRFSAANFLQTQVLDWKFPRLVKMKSR